jgi:hypothetical protein
VPTSQKDRMYRVSFTGAEIRAIERAVTAVMRDMNTLTITFPGRVDQKVFIRAVKALKEGIAAPYVALPKYVPSFVGKKAKP